MHSSPDLFPPQSWEARGGPWRGGGAEDTQTNNLVPAIYVILFIFEEGTAERRAALVESFRISPGATPVRSRTLEES